MHGSIRDLSPEDIACLTRNIELKWLTGSYETNIYMIIFTYIVKNGKIPQYIALA